MVDTRTPPRIGGNFRKYLFVILPRSNSSFHEITRDDKVDKEKEEFFFLVRIILDPRIILTNCVFDVRSGIFFLR